ncbi:hypothetical protein [Nocardioides panacisoli]|uniref:FbpC C-terminal regulatory nucleotide binding domain-containing protein n=1 Tax=Nocardioides panacisoli TaxID=627624 RepID=A0ABP7IEY8_9ACTN
MTGTDLRTTFDAVAQAVPVPPMDRLGFERRVRARRVRRAGGTALVAAAAVAVLAGGAAVVTGDHPGDRDGATVTDSVPDGPASARQTVAVTVRGHLVVLTPDGAAHDSGVRVEEVVALTDEGAVAITTESHLVLIPVRPDGVAGEPRPLVAGAVQRVAVSPDGSQAAYVDLEDVAHVLEVATGREVGGPVPLGPHDRLLSVDHGALLIGIPTGLAVHDGATTEILAPEEDIGGQMAGGVVSYQGYGGVWMFDTDGTQRTGELGAAIGGLSTDGASYATAPSQDQIDDQMSDDLEVLDTATGDRKVVRGFEGDAVQIRWTSADRFLVAADDPRRPGRLLLDCSAAAGLCEQVYDDASATLTLPTR